MESEISTLGPYLPWLLLAAATLIGGGGWAMFLKGKGNAGSAATANQDVRGVQVTVAPQSTAPAGMNDSGANGNGLHAGDVNALIRTALDASRDTRCSVDVERNLTTLVETCRQMVESIKDLGRSQQTAIEATRENQVTLRQIAGTQQDLVRLQTRLADQDGVISELIAELRVPSLPRPVRHGETR